MAKKRLKSTPGKVIDCFGKLRAGTDMAGHPKSAARLSELEKSASAKASSAYKKAEKAARADGFADPNWKEAATTAANDAAAAVVTRFRTGVLANVKALESAAKKAPKVETKPMEQFTPAQRLATGGLAAIQEIESNTPAVGVDVYHEINGIRRILRITENLGGGKFRAILSPRSYQYPEFIGKSWIVDRSEPASPAAEPEAPIMGERIINKDWTSLSESENPPLDSQMMNYGEWRRDVAAKLLPNGTDIQREAMALEISDAVARELAKKDAEGKPVYDQWQHFVVARGIGARLLTGGWTDIIKKAKQRSLESEFARWFGGMLWLEENQEPISVEAYDSQSKGRPLPEGYVREGDQYVYRPKESAGPDIVEGMLITGSAVNTPDGTKKRWMVQTDENKQRVAKGEREIGGNGLYPSREEAVAAIKQQREMERLNAEAKQASEERSQKEAAALAEKEAPLNNFLNSAGLDPMAQGKLKAALKQPATRRSSVTGKIYNDLRYVVIGQMIEDGYSVDVNVVDKVKDLTGRQSNRMTNEEQSAFERRKAQSGLKSEYTIKTADGEFVITKAEYDYGKWYQSNRKAPTEAPKAAEKPVELMTPEAAPFPEPDYSATGKVISRFTGDLVDAARAAVKKMKDRGYTPTVKFAIQQGVGNSIGEKMVSAIPNGANVLYAHIDNPTARLAFLGDGTVVQFDAVKSAAPERVGGGAVATASPEPVPSGAPAKNLAQTDTKPANVNSPAPQLVEREFTPGEILEMRSPYTGDVVSVNYRGPLGDKSVVVMENGGQTSVPTAWLARSREAQLEILKQEFDGAMRVVEDRDYLIEKGKPLPADYVAADREADAILKKIQELEKPIKDAEAKAKAEKAAADSKERSAKRDERREGSVVACIPKAERMGNRKGFRAAIHSPRSEYQGRGLRRNAGACSTGCR
jgi:hypothetical protein